MPLKSNCHLKCIVFKAEINFSLPNKPRLSKHHLTLARCLSKCTDIGHDFLSPVLSKNTSQSWPHITPSSIAPRSKQWTPLIPGCLPCFFCCSFSLMSTGKPDHYSSVVKSCPTLCDPMGCSTPGFPVHHQLLELTQTHVHWVGDAIQPSHPLFSPSSPACSQSQHQGLFKWVSFSHQVAKVLEFQLQHQSFQWMFRTDFL